MQCLPPELISRTGSLMEDRDRASLCQTSRACAASSHEYVEHKTFDLMAHSGGWFADSAQKLARLCERMPMLRTVHLSLVQTAPVAADHVPRVCTFVVEALRVFHAHPHVHVTISINDCYNATALKEVLQNGTGRSENAPHTSNTGSKIQGAAPAFTLSLLKPHRGGDYSIETLYGLAALPGARIASLYTSFPSPSIATAIPCDQLNIFVNPNVFSESLTLDLQQLACGSCSLVCNNIRAYTLDLPVLPPSLDTVVFANTRITQSHATWFQPERLQRSHITVVDFVNHRMPLLRENLSHTLATLQPLAQKRVRVGVPAILAHQLMDVLMAQARPHLSIEFLHNGTPQEYAMALLASRILGKFGCRAGAVHVRFTDFYGDARPCLDNVGTSNADLLALIEPSLAWAWGLLVNGSSGSAIGEIRYQCGATAGCGQP